MHRYLKPVLASAMVAGLLASTAVSASADTADVDVSGNLASALDLPAGVTVESAGTSPQMFGVTSRRFNDFPRRGGSSYVVMSTGKANDLYNRDLAGLQPSTNFGGSPADRASLTFTVAAGTAQKCLLVDVAMATEERVHTYTATTPSDFASLKLNGIENELAMQGGNQLFSQESNPQVKVGYSVNAIQYWHGIDQEFERQPDDVAAPLLAAVTPFDNFSSVETLEVPLDANSDSLPDIATLSIQDANNNSLDTALMVDRVRLTPECSWSAAAETGLHSTRNFEIIGHRGVNNVLSIDLIPETDEIERYDAADNSWFPNGGVDLRFRWYRSKSASTCTTGDMSDWIPLPDADRQTYAPTILERGKCILAVVTGSKDGYRTESFPSPASSAWKATLPIQYGVFTSESAPTIAKAGDPSAIKVNDMLTATNGTFTPRPDSYEYQWYADNLAISGETGQTFKVTGTQAGKKIKVRVTAARLNFDSLPVFSAETNPVDLLQLDSTPTPTITGSGRADDELTAVPGTWQPDPVTLSYQWYAGGAPITGATKATYKPTAAQVGQQLVVAVTGKKASYLPVTKQSDPIVVTLQGFTAPTPIIAGTGYAGDSLTVDGGTWSPTPTTRAYQWFDDDGVITGATRSTYTPTDDQAGQRIYVEVTGKKDGYQDTTRKSTEITVQLRQFAASRPTITGDGFVGSTLAVDRGTWTPTPTFTYQWYANGLAILGATRSSFVPSENERGRNITVQVTGARTNYQSVTMVSDPIAVSIRSFIPGRPQITGTQKVGGRLYASGGSWLPNPTFSYQWKLGSKVLSRGNYLDVPAEAANRQITLEVTANKTYYLSQTVTVTSGRIAYGTLTASVPRISGTARPGKTLRVTTSVRPTPVALRYQWYVGSSAIRGATKSSYKVSRKYRNKKIRVRVTGSKSGYTTVYRYSSYKKIAKK